MTRSTRIALAAGAAAAPLIAPLAARGQAGGDFNGDGKQDLAIGAPYEDINPAGPTPNQVDAGAVWVIYGTPVAPGTEVGGLDPCGPAEGGAASIKDQFFHQGKAVAANSGAYAIPDVPEPDDSFGWSLAVGRFNGDQYDDLAIGVPNESTPDESGVLRAAAGMVIVLFGGPNGLNTTCPPQVWTQASPGIAGTPEEDDHFGYALAAGNFNDDFNTTLPSPLPLDDLAVSAPHEDRLETDDGVVHVIYNAFAASICGLGAGNNVSYPADELLGQGLSGFPDAAEDLDNFGLVLAAGDLNGDGVDDLAIGVPDEDLTPGTTANDHGMVHAAYGTAGAAGGLLAPSAVVTTHTASNWMGPAIGDRYGASLAIGNFDGADAQDLAIGAPTDDVMLAPGVIADSGSVEVIYGPLALPPLIQYWAGGGALATAGALFGAAMPNDRFGFSLAAGDFDGNGSDDLAVGVPWKDIRIGGITYADAGVAHALYSAVGEGLKPSGLCVPTNEYWAQSAVPDFFGQWSDLVGVAQAGDLFGWSLVAGDFDGNGADDLVFGAPGENVNVADSGNITAVYGRAVCGEGLDSTVVPANGIPEDESFHQGYMCPAACAGCGIEDANEAGDQFGHSFGVR